MFRNIKIKNRVFALVALVALGLLIVTVYTAFNTRQALFDEKSLNTQSLVQTAYSLVEHYYGLNQNGELSENEAKNRALRAISNLRYQDENYFWINDITPKMIMHPFKPQLNGQDISNIKDPNGVRLFVEMVEVVKRSGEGFVPYMWPKPGKDKPAAKISYVKSFKPWGWILGSGIYVDDVEETAQQVMLLPVLISFAILGGCFLVGFMIATSILRPLDKTVRALDDISKGNGDLTQRLEEDGKDEITQLSMCFNLFVEKLERSISNLRESCSSLNSSATTFSDVIVKTKTTSDKQESETQAMASAVTEMSTTVSEVAKKAELTAGKTDFVNNQVVHSKKNIDKTSDYVKNVAEQGEKTAQVIDELNDSTQKISTVLDVIRGIAEQTNLLALNAAIEAARAGEQGRGFAVVADEVRTLAAKTQSSTEEIRGMIEDLQKNSESAVFAINENQEKIQMAVEQAELGAKSLAEATEGIDSISEMNIQIASATEEQSYVGIEIDKGINKIAELASVTNEEINRTATESKNLYSISDQISGIVKQFKIR